VLGGDVGRHARISAQPGNGGRVHDHTAPRFAHVRQFVLEAQKYPGDIDVDNAGPVFFGLIGERRGRRQHARIVERDIKRAKLGDCAGDERVHLSTVGNIRLLERCLTTGRHDIVGRRLRAGVDIADDDRCARRCKRERRGAADSVAAPVISTVPPSKLISNGFMDLHTLNR
jgi:hypothetical protein